MHKLLIIDDEPDVAELVSSYFPTNEFSTHIANDGQEACSLLSELKPHLVITDAVLPKFSGHEIIEYIRKIRLKSIIFMMTGFDNISGKDAYDSGVHIFFRKPFNSEELLAAARRFLRHTNPESHYNALSKREMEILEMLAKGMTSKDIAKVAGISVSTVNKHRENMIKRIGAKNTAELLALTKGYQPSE